jgi:tetratricopeptide (TPR) repeat protein
VIIGMAALIAMPSIVAVDRARGAAQVARTAMVDGRFADAATEFEIATRAHPENGGYWLGLGMAEAYSGNGDAAADAYGRAVEASPGDARGYAGLAALRGEDTALLYEAGALTLGDAQYAVRLGISSGQLGLTDDANHAWARAVALRPELLRLLPYDRYGLSMRVVAAEAVQTIQAEPRPAPIENLSKLWDIGLALDELPADAELAWRAVDAGRHGDLETARTLADAAIADASYQARGHQAAAAVAALACDPAAELAALKLEEVAQGSFRPAPDEPAIRREFVYREASLGPTQPPGVGLGFEIERWPWSLIDRPDCS